MLDAARAEREALERNRVGDYDGARKAIEEAVARIREYAGDDLELRKLLKNLQDKAVFYVRDLDPMESKSLHSLSNQTLSGRVLDYARQKALQMAQSASGSVIVPSEWDVETAIEATLKRIAASDPAMSDLDASGLAALLSHTDKRGCLLDPSVTGEGNVGLGFEAATLCRGCHRVLTDAGIPSARIAQIVEALRLLATPSGVVH
jgi:hypothetical protein